MRISTCSERPVLIPCSLENFNYQIDPYVGCEHLCYYCYVLGQAETDWSKEIQIYDDITAQLSDELDKIPVQKIYMGYYSDAYQPCEAEYRQTRSVLKLLLSKGFSVNILTKSDLVVRDIDLLKQMDHASVSVSTAFTDNHVRQLFESKTINTERRIEALRQLRQNGVKTSALICPVIPHISDALTLVDALAPVTDVTWIYGLSILERSDQNWQNLKGILKLHYDNLREQIETIVFSKEHPYWTQLRQDLHDIQTARQINLNIRI